MAALDLVAVVDYVPNAIIDLRYATHHDVLGRPLYEPNFTAQLPPTVATALAVVAKNVQADGLRLVIWDAYRPATAQTVLRARFADDRYVAKVSNHCFGRAVDATLADANGRYLDMGTDFDDFSDRAHLDYADLTMQQQANRQRLQQAFVAAGFELWPYEWWHFNFLADQP